MASDATPRCAAMASADRQMIGDATPGRVAIIGTRDGAAIGVDLALALAAEVLRVVENHPQRPILMLVDTQGQQLSRRDELLGNAGYLAHLAHCFELARARGHLLLSLVYGAAVSGGFLSLGMIADRCYALADAQIRVMALPAMARITRIAIDDLQALCRTSAIFGPGVDNYQRLGAIEEVWDADLAAHLARALQLPAGGDARARLGAARGGRTHAGPVIAAMLSAP
ncbi:malonate decarboxylase gamma subunit [Verminephrobacter eiseniae EF01-2]|uniref:Malonate decarboxylase gamma subunit n=3 Tax=Verminephrobacter eiseniae TaxID=364317 RepID=A1WLX2_VEREI|nr:malonate decarboxylase gamma subunit [Verminephrobacter eiseniae EF01-2]